MKTKKTVQKMKKETQRAISHVMMLEKMYLEMIKQKEKK
jgi:hypothetical protein